MEELRQEIIYPYAEKMGNCEVVLLGGDHMIYEQKPEVCGEVIKAFIDGLDSKIPVCRDDAKSGFVRNRHENNISDRRYNGRR